MLTLTLVLLLVSALVLMAHRVLGKRAGSVPPTIAAEHGESARRRD